MLMADVAAERRPADRATRSLFDRLTVHDLPSYLSADLLHPVIRTNRPRHILVRLNLIVASVQHPHRQLGQKRCN